MANHPNRGRVGAVEWPGVLVAWRQRHKVSEGWLADRLGVAQWVLEEWECGKVAVDSEDGAWLKGELRRISNHLKNLQTPEEL